MSPPTPKLIECDRIVALSDCFRAGVSDTLLMKISSLSIDVWVGVGRLRFVVDGDAELIVFNVLRVILDVRRDDSRLVPLLPDDDAEWVDFIDTWDTFKFGPLEPVSTGTLVECLFPIVAINFPFGIQNINQHL